MDPIAPPFLLLDRDGVLNEDRSDSVRAPEQLILLPGVGEALRLLHAAGTRVLVITNQACVGKGLVTPATLDAIHALLQQGVAAAGGVIDAIYHCPHTDAEACPCRKPRPGLLQQAQAAWGFDMSQTWFVGDAERDVAAARAAGCRPALVRTGKGAATAEKLPDVPVFDTLLDFVHAFLSHRLP